MKVLYVYDHKFIYWNNEYYSEGKFSNEIFSRYDVLESEIYILCRVISRKNFNPSQYNKIDKKNINFFPVKGISFFKIFTLYFFYNFFLIFRLFLQSNLLIVRMPSILGLFVSCLNIFFKKKYCIEVVGDGLESWLKSRKKINFMYKNIALFLDIIRKKNIYNATGVIYVTKEYLQCRYPTKGIQVVASNVNVNVKEREMLIERYIFKKNKKIKIGLIGSFNNEYKGIETAIKSIDLLSNKNVILEIVGSGTLLTEYKNLAAKLGIENRIFFKGSIQGGDSIINWLSQLDIYIQPSYTEGLPRALIEAMSVGLPCIGSSVGGIPELLKENFLVPPKDEVELAKKISFLLADINERFSQGKFNYERSKLYDSKYLDEVRFKFWNQIKDII